MKIIMLFDIVAIRKERKQLDKCWSISTINDLNSWPSQHNVVNTHPTPPETYKTSLKCHGIHTKEKLAKHHLNSKGYPQKKKHMALVQQEAERSATRWKSMMNRCIEVFEVALNHQKIKYHHLQRTGFSNNHRASTFKSPCRSNL